MTDHVHKADDQKVWHAYLNRLKDKDIYFTPEYGKIHELNGEGEAMLYIYEEGDDFIYYPFLKRRLSELTSLQTKMNLFGELYDITTPYGYGGPLTNVSDSSRRRILFQNFADQFQTYCQSERIITEFIRFHPLIENHGDCETVESIHLRDTIHIDLTKELAEIWSDYDSPNRNRIRKAGKKGLQVHHKALNDREDFLRIYYETMEKHRASSYYYFSEEYFNNKAELLKENAELLEVVYEGKVVFSGIFMSYGDFVHYDLVGSDREYLSYCPNNFVIDYAAKWAKAKGKKYLHLGGGYTGDDSLFRFKKRFNRRGSRPFYIGKKVHDEVIYQRLTEDLGGDSGFFPKYRDPALAERKRVVVG